MTVFLALLYVIQIFFDRFKKKNSQMYQSEKSSFLFKSLTAIETHIPRTHACTRMRAQP